MGSILWHCLDDELPACRSNIIAVMADDLGWSDVECYGGESETPHIDSLAQDGLCWTQFDNGRRGVSMGSLNALGEVLKLKITLGRKPTRECE